MSFARKIVKIQKIGYIYFYHISRKPITACKLGQLIEPKYLNKTWWNRLSFTTDVLYSELLSILSHLFWRWQVHSSSPSFLLQHFPRISFSFPLGWCCLTTHRLWHCSCIFLMFLWFYLLEFRALSSITGSSFSSKFEFRTSKLWSETRLGAKNMLSINYPLIVSPL